MFPPSLDLTVYEHIMLICETGNLYYEISRLVLDKGSFCKSIYICFILRDYSHVEKNEVFDAIFYRWE